MNANIQKRIDALNWNEAEESLSARGYAITDAILTPEECASIISLYNEPTRFRSQVIMERHRFGVGDYRYFANPLPEIVADLRTSAYSRLAPIANQWAKAFGEPKAPFPLDHAAFLKTCHRVGQTKPTPLVLHYEAGGYNCLHQDLYGEIAFPLHANSFSTRAAGARLARRRIPPDGTATSRTIQRRSGHCQPGPGDHLRHALSTRERFARLLSRQSPPRSQSRSSRYSLYARYHLPRREVAATFAWASAN